MDTHSDFVLIPHDRVGALIGRNGATKRKIERLTSTKIGVDGKEGEVEVTQHGQAIEQYKAMRIIKAIGRGFSPENALLLMDDNTLLEIIDAEEEVGGGPGTLKAKKGRVIGSHGKARGEIERDTGAKISVYGKTIAIIGSEEQIHDAKKAVEMLLHGASHARVYGSLKRGFDDEKFEL